MARIGALAALLALTPFSAADTIEILSPTVVRDQGAPVTEAFDFGAPSELDGFLQITNGPEGFARISSATIILNGDLIVGPDSFNQDVALIELSALILPGENVLEIELASTPGAAIQLRLFAEVDALGAPTIDPPPAVTGSSSVVISGSAFLSTSVEICGPEGIIEVPVTDEHFSALVPLGANRLNRIFATAIAVTGLRSPPGSVTVIQDSNAPSLFIDFPADGAELTLDAIDVGGRVGDLLSGFMGLTVEVNGQPAEVSVGIGNNGTFFLEALPLEMGVPTVITATATDDVGNSVTRQIAVERVEVPAGTPFMEASAGNGQTGAIGQRLAQPITVQVLRGDLLPFANKVVTFDVTRSNGRLSSDQMSDGALMLQVRTDAAGVASAWWTLGSDAGRGNNRVAVSSTSIVGSVLFCASAEPGPAAQINVGGGEGQRVEVGGTTPDGLRVWVNDTCNGIENVSVTYAVVRGNGHFDGAGSITVQTGRTGHAEVPFTLGSTAGNNVVEASFAGNPTAVASFTVFGVQRELDAPTRLVGVVMDNGNQLIQGATCSLSVGGVELGPIFSGVDGRFVFDDVPGVGPAELHVDGLTATHIGGTPGTDVMAGSFPALSYDLVIVPNASNSLPVPVRMPTLDPANAKVYDGTQDVELTVEGVAGLRMLIRAGSMTRPDGSVPSPSDPAIVTLNQVHADDVPMPMPDGAAPPLAWTLQPSGAHFDPPVEVVYPNMSGLAPGSIAYFLSFDHDTGRFEIVATGSVSSDGSQITTDPGAGLAVSGWGCNCPPYAVTAECEDKCENDPAVKAQVAALKQQQSAAWSEAQSLFNDAYQQAQGLIGPDGGLAFAGFAERLAGFNISWTTLRFSFSALRTTWAIARIACLIAIPEPTIFGEIACASLLIVTSAEMGIVAASAAGTLGFGFTLLQDLQSAFNAGQAIGQLGQAAAKADEALSAFLQIQAICAALAVNDSITQAVADMQQRIQDLIDTINELKAQIDAAIQDIQDIINQVQAIQDQVDAWIQEIQDALDGLPGF